MALAYAWAAYPYTAFVLETNANDTLVALACIAALLAFTRGEPAAGWGDGRGAAAPGAGPRWAASRSGSARRPSSPRSRWRRCSRGGHRWSSARRLSLTLAVTVLPFVPDGGLRELYDRTLGYQAGRGSPFSVWGQVDSLDWLQTVVKVGAVGLALAVAFVPRRPDERQVAALGAAVLIALQLAVTHWFYLYVVWFVPFVLVAMFGAYRERVPEAAEHPEREAEAVAA